ncbi:MAG TPA: PilN domain-containing protein [Pyrinomonadaceae bacterium]|nr:PilN domain-containing protein [Pyrinomonadaceae bacterium]
MIKVNLLDSVTERSQSGAAAVEAKVANPAARFWMLGASVFVLLGLAMTFDYYSAAASQKKAKAELEKQEQIAQQMAAINKEQADLEKKLKDIQARIDVIKKLRTSQQGPVSLLSDLNARLPKDPDFRLLTIEQKGGELVIQGQSPNEYSVTQFGRALEFSDNLFQNVSLSAARVEVEIKKEEYGPAEGPIDEKFKPEVFTFTIKCKYGPSQPSADEAKAEKPAKKGRKKK